ncbi:GAP family protein [Microbacterium sp. NIBRBAC000506063]|uniref:GAP family protein n=1 Tax=Microbacterium sp. NIBRBAC000506063 TaxID=2734618 RepID=UPI001CB7440F|nr:GAP family protein [Microbacterium sp. NIBRBAC000506063]
MGSSELDTGALALTVGIFTLLAGSTVLVLVLGYLAASDRLAAALDALRVWLSRENAVIMCVVLAVLGAVVVGKGIGSL